MSEILSQNDLMADIAAQRISLQHGTGHTIDPTIEDLVVIFNSMGIRTERSCGGHLEADTQDLSLSPFEIKDLEGQYIGAPYVSFTIIDDQKLVFLSERKKDIRPLSKPTTSC